MKKRLLSILLAMCMVLSLLPTTARAAWDDYGYFGEIGATESVAWMVDLQSGLLNFTGEGKMREVTGDISITIPWFKYSTQIKEVAILNSTDVSNICTGGVAFFTSLQRANIPRVTQIGVSAFWGCAALKEIIFSSSMSEIGKDAFRECVSLTNVDLPSGLDSISFELFYECMALTSVNIPNGVTDIDDRAFIYWNCQEKCSRKTHKIDAE